MMVSPTPSTCSPLQVVVRLRPMNEKEKKHGTLPVIMASTQEKTVTVIKGQGSRQFRSCFSFDNVFTAFSSQEEVFNATLKPVIGDVMRGYESTVFAYGQTGTGKTHTMEGHLQDPDKYGVIPRSAQAIFEALKKPEYNSHVLVSCSYLEIYNEDLCDLLIDENQRFSDKKTMKLEIMEGKNGTFCRGLTEREVKSAEDVLTLMQKAQRQRKIGETKMNKQSSRSHCIFSIHINAKKTLIDGGTLEFNGKLHMVDLAGSECAKTSSLEKSSISEAARERERMNINRSLLTLGRVISMLKEQSENKKSQNLRIPYRDSKLTRILQESLGGRCKTMVIATLSPSVTAVEESISTLNYAQTAIGIVNKPVVTSYLSITPPLTSSYASSINENVTIDQANSVEHWHEMECKLLYMQIQVEESQAALARKHMQQQELVERAEKAENKMLELEKRHLKASQNINSLKDELVIEKDQKNLLKVKICQMENNLKKNNVILDATKKTEEKLTFEALSILDTLKDSLSESNTLHCRLEEAKEFDIQQRKATRDFHSTMSTELASIIFYIKKLSFLENNQMKRIMTATKDKCRKEEYLLIKSSDILKEITLCVSKLISTMKLQLTDNNGLVPVMSRFSEKELDIIQNTKCIIEQGEDSLSKSFQYVHNKLKEYSEHIRYMDSACRLNSGKILSDLVSSISELKKNIDKIVSFTTNALSIIRTSSLDTVSALDNIHSQWKKSLLFSASNIEKSALSQKNKMSKPLETCLECIRRHDEIDLSLSKQHCLIQETGSNHLKGMASQISIISSLRKKFIDSQTRQSDLQRKFVNNVMNGVHDILNSQMEWLEKDRNEILNTFEKTNSCLIEKNTLLSSTAKLIFDEVLKTNKFISEHIKSERVSNTFMEEVFNESKKVLSDLENMSKKQRTSSLFFANKANLKVEQHLQNESIVGSIVENIKKYRDNCFLHLSELVFRDTYTGISDITKFAMSLSQFTTEEVIRNTKLTLNEMMNTREDTISITSNRLQEVCDTILKGKNKLKGIINEQYQTADGLYQNVLSICNYFHNVDRNLRQEEIHKHKDFMMVNTESHSRGVSQILLSSLDQMSCIKDNISDFSTKVIKSDENITTTPARKVIKYNENFSSTPSEEIILKDLYLLPTDQCSSPNNVRSNRRDEYNLNVEQRNFCNDIIDSSSTQSEISSLCRSPLKERPLNRDKRDSPFSVRSFNFCMNTFLKQKTIVNPSSICPKVMQSHTGAPSTRSKKRIGSISTQVSSKTKKKKR